MRKRVHVDLILGLGLVFGLFLASASGPQSPDQAQATAGQSTTLLPDGRWLIAGGEAPGGLLGAAAIRDPRTGVTTSLAGRLQHPRAWHTATLLPDGTVLLFGGVGADGILLGGELFDPETESFEPLPFTGLTPRAQHTATLLTDGRVLIVGGLAETGETLAQAELWDPREGGTRPLSGALATARRGHSAALLPSGAVLLWGGADEADRALDDGELYDPGSQQFLPLATSPHFSDTDPPQLEASVPEDDAEDVSPDTLIAFRFSNPLRVETVTASTVRLAGPGVEERVKVVPAEGGMLAFVTPEAPLLPGAAYTLSLRGLMDTRGLLLSPATVSFRTAAEKRRGPLEGGSQGSPSEPWAEPRVEGARRPAPDDEDWAPLPGTWTTGRPPSPWQSLPPLQAAPGVTALAGQVLTLAGEPLADATLEIDSRAVKTDRTGRFLLGPIPPGHQELVIDGRTANRQERTYGLFEVGIEIRAQETNVLPYTIWMTRLDTAHAVTIPSPTAAEVVVTTPRIPGLELRIPPNTVIRDHDGKVVRTISITPVPVDRPPFPLARNVKVPVYFTVQPGGAYVYGPAGVRLIYPNRAGLPPGARLNFWRYNASEVGWSIYGLGTVTRNGKQVVPNPGVVLYEFSEAMLTPGMVPPDEGTLPEGTGSTPGTEPPRDGDPVDLATGLFVLTKTDLFLPDIIPLVLRRTYRQDDPNPRPFGIGASHPYEMFLWSASDFQEANLVLPDGGRVHYVRTSSGTGFANAVFEHTATPTRFQNSRIVWNGDGWTLSLKNGSALLFGENAPLQAIRDRYGNTVTILRDDGQSGNISTILSPNGRWLAFTYDAGNRITRVTDNLGRTVNYTYDASSRLVTVTDSAGGLTDYTYDDTDPGDPIRKTRMLTLKDPRRIVFLTNAYDANGRVIRQTQADQSFYQFAYTLDANGKVTRTDVTDPRGTVRRVAFSATGYPLTDTRAVGTQLAQTLTYERQVGTDLVISATDPVGRRTAYTYDALANVTAITRLAGTPEAVTTTFTYEPAFNQLASLTDPLGHTATFSYDALGNLAAVTNPLGHQTTLTQDVAGRPISMTDAVGNITRFTYDSGDLVAVTDALGNITRRFVDGAGRLSILTDRRGHQTRYEHDVLNRLTRLTDALGGVTAFAYDPNGNLLSVTDARGSVTSYSYDSMDRLTSRTDPLLHAESYAYDAMGNLARFTDRKSQATTATYDALNRRTKLTYADLSTTTYTWDSASRLTQVVDSLAGSITLGYDSLDRLTQETSPQGAVSYTYDAAGRRISMTVTGQPAVTYAYDNANRLTQITQGASTVAFGYDATRRRTSLTLPNGVVTEYAYDAASRLTGITYRQGATVIGDLTYGYDATGNRTQMAGSFASTDLPQPVASATYDAGNRQLTFGNRQMAYDANGNVTSISDPGGATTFAWDARNRLVQLAGPGVTASFAYDGAGRRTSKQLNGQLTRSLYDGLGVVQEVVSGTAVNYLRGLSIDEVLVRNASEFYLADALGSTVALTDAAGTVTTRYLYDPFGDTAVEGLASQNPFQYTGRENDGTGLYYYRARYYLPALHRFVSQDSATRLGGNPYAYVHNSPLNAIDPFGLFTIIVHGGPASSGPSGSSDKGGNPGLNVLQTALERGGERVERLNSGQIDEAMRLATQAQAAGEPVYIVGHSLGGSAAIELAKLLPEPPTHLYTIDAFLPNRDIPADIATTNFFQREGLPFGSTLQGENVQNVLIEGLGLGGHFSITRQEQLQTAITEQVLTGRK